MSMIASVLHLDRAAIKALRVTDPYSLHRVVYGLYSDTRDDAAKAAGASSGILWADQGGDFRGRKILLLANRAPSEQANGGHGLLVSKMIGEGFLNHGHYQFKVIVNSVRRDLVSGKLVPIKGREAVAAWFVERASASWGFAVAPEHLLVERIEVLRFTDKAQRPVTLAQARVSGQLRVIAREQFQKSFTQGIGRGRCFGCGLLQIVPLLDIPFAQPHCIQ
jgi:CRISPR system Cascade subunit CasE